MFALRRSAETPQMAVQDTHSHPTSGTVGDALPRLVPGTSAHPLSGFLVCDHGQFRDPYLLHGDAAYPFLVRFCGSWSRVSRTMKPPSPTSML